MTFSLQEKDRPRHSSVTLWIGPVWPFKIKRSVLVDKMNGVMTQKKFSFFQPVQQWLNQCCNRCVKRMPETLFIYAPPCCVIGPHQHLTRHFELITSSRERLCNKYLAADTPPAFIICFQQTTLICWLKSLQKVIKVDFFVMAKEWCSPKDPPSPPGCVSSELARHDYCTGNQ